MQNFYLDHINKIRRYLDPQTAKCVVNALVLSRLDYCNSLFVGLPGDLLKRLQHVQNSAARTVLNRPRREPVRQHLKSLGWLPVLERAEKKVACLTYRCINGLAPLHLSKLVFPYTPERDLRSAGKNLLKTKPYRLAHYGKRAFSCAAPAIWNSFPDTARLATTLFSFRSRVYRELFAPAYPE